MCGHCWEPDFLPPAQSCANCFFGKAVKNPEKHIHMPRLDSSDSGVFVVLDLPDEIILCRKHCPAPDYPKRQTSDWCGEWQAASVVVNGVEHSIKPA